ncbi:hypothetical protein F5Y08DRAFT_180707 [Xylaria arbuscula]|nr:hypothetical protein F5Y08DRAFT_180707 [Xylaria arbuscula]
MERDSRRDQGEWRGCHNFDKIICDGDVPTSSERRGLKMGQRYYYYYEVDGSTETHNPSLPSTTACPFLPGQTVNTLDVPSERRTRLKSASMNSLRNTEYKTMDPVDRFATPRPPPIPSNRREFRIASASSILPKRSTRSVSPGPSWTGTARRILGFKSRDRESERGRKSNLTELEDVFVEVNDPSLESRSVTPSGSIRSRELSPESLRKFLSDDLPATLGNPELMHGFSIPDDIEEEIEEIDDDNFADTVVSESNSFTNLSPPPSQRGGLSAPPASHSKNTSPQSLAPPVFNVEGSLPAAQRSKPRPAKLDIPRSHSTLSVASSSMASAGSPKSNISQGLSQVSFFDDSDDDEDLSSCPGDQTLLTDARQDSKEDQEASGLQAPITSYSLPRASPDNKDLGTNNVLQSMESPAGNLYRLPDVDVGLDELDVNWMNEVVPRKTL